MNMPEIRLPDGSVRSYDAPLSGAEIAADIGKGLARDALAVRIDGELGARLAICDLRDCDQRSLHP